MLFLEKIFYKSAFRAPEWGQQVFRYYSQYIQKKHLECRPGSASGCTNPRNSEPTHSTLFGRGVEVL